MDTLNFDKAGGLVSAIAQDYQTGAVLMIAWMNREAFEETVRTGRAVYFSRSRGKLWRKGEESGNVQEVKGIYVDCDADAQGMQAGEGLFGSKRIFQKPAFEPRKISDWPVSRPALSALRFAADQYSSWLAETYTSCAASCEPFSRSRLVT